MPARLIEITFDGTTWYCAAFATRDERQRFLDASSTSIDESHSGTSSFEAIVADAVEAIGLDRLARFESDRARARAVREFLRQSQRPGERVPSEQTVRFHLARLTPGPGHDPASDEDDFSR